MYYYILLYPNIRVVIIIIYHHINILLFIMCNIDIIINNNINDNKCVGILKYLYFLVYAIYLH